MARTVTETARRGQIVQAAIEVIATEGYAKASYARIAKQAGLSSTGMISYHFAGKGDLLREVVGEVLRLSGEYIVPRVEAQSGGRARLRAFIEANVGLAAVYPQQLLALMEVLNVLGEDPQGQFAETRSELMEAQVRAVQAAQETGEFGQFDARVLVTAIRGAVDAVLSRAVKDPALDPLAAARELAELFDRAVRPAN
ncbi:TetR family transcriptional regulator [Streptomyces tateyamensis]|uniref:TetR family transcriptional regulator n=1 Tax=Streptomyces tateyamensis TaxID=565073 RepID=A0A2V4NHG9_9ACTN|nr:TetR/AcrR family transcriptional regulator [Streptomyces tateyamensis]PYC79758.1 TetR family transcriptional regulator [Streptomyces tateyamensis]